MRKVYADERQAAWAPMKTRIGILLKERGWSEQDLADRSGLKQSYLNRVKNGKILPNLRSAYRICNALGVNIDDAFIYNEPLVVGENCAAEQAA